MPEESGKPSAALARCGKSADKQFLHASPVEPNKKCADLPKWIIDFELEGSAPLVLGVEADGAAKEPLLLDLDAGEVSATVLDVDVEEPEPLVLDLDVS